MVVLPILGLPPVPAFCPPQPAEEEDSPGTLNIGGKDTWSVIARFAF